MVVGREAPRPDVAFLGIPLFTQDQIKVLLSTFAILEFKRLCIILALFGHVDSSITVPLTMVSEKV